MYKLICLCTCFRKAKSQLRQKSTAREPYDGTRAIRRHASHTTAREPYDGTRAIRRHASHSTAREPYDGTRAIRRHASHTTAREPYDGTRAFAACDSTACFSLPACAAREHGALNIAAFASVGFHHRGGKVTCTTVARGDPWAVDLMA
jgi:hypothetical protein